MRLCRLPALLVAALAGAACLEGGAPVEGRLLHAGTEIEHPQLEDIDGELWVTFEVRKARAQNGLGGRLDVHRVRWSDGHTRLVVANRSDTWPVATDARGFRYYMTDERIAPDGPAVAIATLVRVNRDDSPVQTITDVRSFSLNRHRGELLAYQKHVPGAPHPDLYLRNLDGHERALDSFRGELQLLGDEGPVYFLAGEDHALTRVDGLGGEARRLRSRVSRYMLRGDQTYAIASVSEMGKVKTLVLDLTSGEEKPLPVENPCCWLGLGDAFVFGESARPGIPARLHTYDIVKGEDRVLTMPEGLVDVSGLLGRPHTNQMLIFDRQRRVAVFRPDAEPQMRLLEIQPDAPRFTDDGRHLLYIERDPPPPGFTSLPAWTGGKLMVQDGDLARPPMALSPHGASVPSEPPGFFPTRREGPHSLVFWARYGLGASDLYFGDYETGHAAKVAVGIGEFAFTETGLLAIVRISQQDLTGDLVHMELRSGHEHALAHGVAEMTGSGRRLAFVVRERAPASPRNGLWAATLP